MDKYEYRVKTEQMLDYAEKKQYKRAMEIADTIDWRRVKNVSMLNTVSEIYEFAGEFQKSRDVLLMAYDRSPESRKIMYRLGTLALRVGDADEASDCYEEFIKLAPKDPNQYILKYKILAARSLPIKEQIQALEEFKRAEYVEKWAYELAQLYHKAGMTAECMEECDDLILWFSEGKYVYRAMELKMKYKPLTPLQEEKYNAYLAANGKPPLEKKSFVNKEDAPKKETDAKKREEEDLKAGKAAGEEEKEEKRREGAPIQRNVKGATLEEAIAKGVAVANSLNIEGKADVKKDEDMRITGQMKIEEILAEWEAKQRTNAQAIEKQRKKDEEELSKKREEEEKRRLEEARRLEAQQRAAEEERRLREQKEAEEERRLAKEKEEEEKRLAKEREEEEKRIAREKVAEEERLLERLAAGREAAKERILEEEKTKKQDERKESEPVKEEDPEPEEEKTEAEPKETKAKAKKAKEPAAKKTKAQGAKTTKKAKETKAEETKTEEKKDEKAKESVSEVKKEEEKKAEEIGTGLTTDIKQLMAELEKVGKEQEEEEKLAKEKAKKEREEPPVHDGPDEEDGDFEDYDDLDEDDLDEDDFEDDDFEDDLDEDDFEEADFEEADFQEEDAPEREEEPEIDEVKAQELVIEEPTEEEIQRRIKKGKTGVPFDTGFVVTGRYDLSATSEIGLKAGLTEDQKKLFSYFVPVRGMSEQIVEVLDNDRREQREGSSRTGNILVIGNKGTGKTVLAVDIVKAIQKQRNLRQGKVAIVTGEALNKKELPNIIQKLKGGAIIIEKAGKLNSRTVKELNLLMEKQTGELLFVLEEQRKPLERLFTANPEFKKKFTSRLELPVFINDELVTFGQTYAKENGYKLDEMGILALYSRIDVMQREDHAVTVAEVKEIVDEAIEHSRKANVKHLARRMFGKGVDDSDRIILREEDFKR